MAVEFEHQEQCAGHSGTAQHHCADRQRVGLAVEARQQEQEDEPEHQHHDHLGLNCPAMFGRGERRACSSEGDYLVLGLLLEESLAGRRRLELHDHFEHVRSGRHRESSCLGRPDLVDGVFDGPVQRAPRFRRLKPELRQRAVEYDHFGRHPTDLLALAPVVVRCAGHEKPKDQRGDRGDDTLGEAHHVAHGLSLVHLVGA